MTITNNEYTIYDILIFTKQHMTLGYANVQKVYDLDRPNMLIHWKVFLPISWLYIANYFNYNNRVCQGAQSHHILISKLSSYFWTDELLLVFRILNRPLALYDFCSKNQKTQIPNFDYHWYLLTAKSRDLC